MAIWSRNKIWGASTFNTDVDVADNTNNASQVPATSFLGLKISSSVDAESRNRSKWFTSVIGQLLRAVLHKEEDRATSSDLGVSGTEPTTTKYVTVEQLPSVDKESDDFTISAVEADGAISNAQDMFVVNPVTTGTNKIFRISFSTFAVKWLKVRTWLESDLVTLITDTASPLITAAINTIPARVVPITSLVVDASVNTISTTGFVDLTNITYTTPNDGTNRKYQIIFRGRTSIQTNISETINLQIKLYNSTDSVDYDITNNYLNNDVGFIQLQENCVLMTIQTIPPNKTIKVAALRTGTSSPTIQDCKFSIIEIK